MMHVDMTIRDKHFAPSFGGAGAFRADFGAQIVIHEDDYNALRNKPTIEGVEVVGELSLADFGTEKFTTAEKTKLGGIEAGAQVNIIEKIYRNGKLVEVEYGAVDIAVPENMSELYNNAHYVADAHYVHTDNNYDAAAVAKLGGIEAGAQVNVFTAALTNEEIDALIAEVENE